MSRLRAKQLGQKARRRRIPQQCFADLAMLVSALNRDGHPAYAAASPAGAALSVARRERAARYPELSRVRLGMLGVGVGRHWSKEAGN